MSRARERESGGDSGVDHSRNERTRYVSNVHTGSATQFA